MGDPDAVVAEIRRTLMRNRNKRAKRSAAQPDFASDLDFIEECFAQAHHASLRD
jgi:hypothetical protein